MEIDKYSKVSDFIQGDQISLGNQEYEFVESIISSCFRCAFFNDNKKCLASSEIGNCVKGYFMLDEKDILVLLKAEAKQLDGLLEFKDPNTEMVLSIPEYRDWETDRKSTRLNSSHSAKSRMPSSA